MRGGQNRRPVPYTIHAVLTDNGIEHRLTKVKHHWMNG